MNGTNIGSALPTYQVNGTNNVTMTNGMNYALRLQLDFTSNDVSNIKINNGQWAVTVRTQFVNFADAKIPVLVDDFWGGFVMDSTYNYVDNTLSGTSLKDNSRIVNNPSDGRTNGLDYIEDLFFTTYANTTTTNTSANRLFGLSAVHIYDTPGNDYAILSSGIKKLTLEQPYVNIISVPEPSTAGMLAVGAGIVAYMRRKQKKNSKHSDGRMTAGRSSAKKLRNCVA